MVVTGLFALCIGACRVSRVNVKIRVTSLKIYNYYKKTLHFSFYLHRFSYLFSPQKLNRKL